MTFFGMALLTAVGTVVLALFAIVTAWYARRAFLKQSQEVAAIERQVADGQELTRQQAELLKVQTGQLEVLRAQLEDQRAATAKQAEELREALEERRHAAEEKRRAQAAQVTTWFAKQPHSNGPFAEWGAMIRNNSDLPILDVGAAFHRVAEPVKGLGWTPLPVGTSLKSVRVLPPRTERHLPIAPDTAAQDPQCDDDVYVASITFTDAAGNRWERDARGALKPFS